MGEHQNIDRARQILVLALAALAFVLLALLVVAAWQNRFDAVLTELVVGRFPAIIGLPFAALAAFLVVALFRQGEGPIEFEIIGAKFKGAAGQILLWIACFLSISAAIKLLW